MTLKTIEGVLEDNYRAFITYAKIHAAKNTREGDEKAHKNLVLAAETQKALQVCKKLRESAASELKAVTILNNFMGRGSDG